MKEYTLEIGYSWEEDKTTNEFDTFDEAWNTAKTLAMEEAEDSSVEWKCEIRLIIDKPNGNIYLHYTYDDTWCYYSVIQNSK